MDSKALVHKWFDKWESGDFLNLPITDDFRHKSPYGTIDGKAAYLDIVSANREQFLGHRFELHDELYAEGRACVRYTGRKKDFALEVSEWYRFRDGLIAEIVAYYNIEGEISEERKLEGMGE